MGDFKPRKYQSEGIQIGIDFLTSPAKNPSLMVFPCAAGKSHIIAEIVRGLEEPTLVVVPSQELLTQNYEKFVHAGGIASLYSASVNSKIISKVTFATIGSLKGKAAEFKAYGVRNIIVDEAHFSIPPEKDSVFSTFIRELGSPRILGLTATPFLLKGGMDGSSLKMLTRVRPKLFKDILYVSQISEMVENNWWSPLEYELHPFDVSQLDLNTTGANYTEASIKLALDTQGVNNRIYKRILQLQEEGAKSILVFVDSVESAELFASKIPNSTYVHGGTNKSERLKAVEDFKGGQTQVMFNYGTFCLDLETEILTESGWVRHNEMTFQHKVANWDNGVVYYKEPLQVIKRPLYKDEFMISLSSKNANFRVTNTHDMLIKSSKTSRWIKSKSEALLTTKAGKRVPTCGVLNELPIYHIPISSRSSASVKRRLAANSYHLRKGGMSAEDAKAESMRRIEISESLTYTDPHNLNMDECFFIGFYIGDGSHSYSKNEGNRYSISQSLRYPLIINKIEHTLKELGVHFKRYKLAPTTMTKYSSYTWNLSNGTGFGPQKVKGIFHLTPYLNKNGCEYLKGLNAEQLWQFLLGFWYADGDHGTGEKVPSSLLIHNTNLELLTLLQQIAITRGMSAKIKQTVVHTNGYKTQYRFSVNRNTTLHIGAGMAKPTKEEWKAEDVWCVQSHSSNIITRRGGKVVVMGNCTGFDYPGLSHVILGRPSNSFSLIYQMGGRVVRIDPTKEKGTIIDFCGNIENFGKLEDMTIEDYPNYGWGVFSGDRLLTGYSLKGPKIYKKNLVPKKELPKGEGGNYTINIGKFKGQSLSKVKRSYLEYMVFTSGFDFSRGPMKEFYEKTKKYLESTKMQFVK